MATPTNATADGRSPIKFGTSGWRGLIADEFTFANVRLAVTAIAGHVKAKTVKPTILVGYDTRFYSDARHRLRNPKSEAGRRDQLHGQPQSRAIPWAQVFFLRCRAGTARDHKRCGSASGQAVGRRRRRGASQRYGRRGEDQSSR